MLDKLYILEEGCVGSIRLESDNSIASSNTCIKHLILDMMHCLLFDRGLFMKTRVAGGQSHYFLEKNNGGGGEGTFDENGEIEQNNSPMPVYLTDCDLQ